MPRRAVIVNPERRVDDLRLRVLPLFRGVKKNPAYGGYDHSLACASRRPSASRPSGVTLALLHAARLGPAGGLEAAEAVVGLVVVVDEAHHLGHGVMPSLLGDEAV